MVPALPAPLPQMSESELNLDSRLKVTAAQEIDVRYQSWPKVESLRLQLPWIYHLRSPRILKPEVNLLAVLELKGKR